MSEDPDDPAPPLALTDEDLDKLRRATSNLARPLAYTDDEKLAATRQLTGVLYNNVSRASALGLPFEDVLGGVAMLCAMLIAGAWEKPVDWELAMRGIADAAVAGAPEARLEMRRVQSGIPDSRN